MDLVRFTPPDYGQMATTNPTRERWYAAFELGDRKAGESMLALWQRKLGEARATASSSSAAREDERRLRSIFEGHAEYADLVQQETAHALAESRAGAERVLGRFFAPRVVAGAMSDDKTPATDAVARWLAKGKPRSLVLRGGVGVGKTVAGARWLAHELMAGVGAASVASYRHDAIVGPVLHGYDIERNPPMPQLCVIDDLGRETKADFVEALCAVLDEGTRTLLMTTNLSRESMRERYDARLIDRLNDACLAVDVKGDSRRRQDGGF